jgi:hypothetical protein
VSDLEIGGRYCGIPLWSPAVLSRCGLALWSPALGPRCDLSLVGSRFGLLMCSPTVGSRCGLQLGQSMSPGSQNRWPAVVSRCVLPFWSPVVGSRCGLPLSTKQVSCNPWIGWFTQEQINLHTDNWLLFFKVSGRDRGLLLWACHVGFRCLQSMYCFNQGRLIYIMIG